MQPFKRLCRLALVMVCLSSTTLAVAATSVHSQAALPADNVALDIRPVGRVVSPGADGVWRYQWPGTYFEARFIGRTVYVNLGAGAKHARISIDGQEVADLVRPEVPYLRINGLPAREHEVRVDMVNESQAGVQTFGGFAVPAGQQAPRPRARTRFIEFIGDSYTVGYGLTSSTRECSGEKVWQTTDTSLAFGPRVARHFGADYRIMAISGRGMVRNFSNLSGPTLPEAYARLLPGLAGSVPEPADAGWAPQLIVVGLGTNDFSKAVTAGEPWTDGTALAAAFEARYMAFIQGLQGQHPMAQFILLATDAGNGAAERAILRIQTRLNAVGRTPVTVLALGKLDVSGCDWHPSLSDHERIATRLIAEVERLGIEW